MFKVLICGGRDFYEEFTQDEAETYVCEVLSTLLDPLDKEDVIFISGMARGADQIPIKMKQEDSDWGGIEEYHADWDTYKKRAGPLRNIRMLEEGKPNLVIAFPTKKSRGTHHMIDISRKAGVSVYVYDKS